MKHRRLGRTNLAVSAIGVGTGDNAGLFVNSDRKTLNDFVARATELGVNFFDTAPDYGKGIAEYQLGGVLRDLRIDPIIVSKLELYPQHLGNIEAATLASIEASLARLGREQIDVLMVHNPVRPSRTAEDIANCYWMPIVEDELLGPVLSALEKARGHGKVKHFGLSLFDADPASAARVVDSRLFDLANVSLNLVNPSSLGDAVYEPEMGQDYHGVLDRLVAADAGCSVIQPLAAGALTPEVAAAGGGGGDDPRNAHTGWADMVKRARQMQVVADQLGLSITELAYRFLLSHPAVSTVVGGFSAMEHLESAVAYASRGELGADVMAQLLSTRAETAT